MAFAENPHVGGLTVLQKGSEIGGRHQERELHPSHHEVAPQERILAAEGSEYWAVRWQGMACH